MNVKPVKAQHDKILIVGSSPEARNFEPIPGFTVIAVNGAIDITREHTDYWFTLDPSTPNMKIMNKKPYPCEYFAAVPLDFGTPKARCPIHRKAPQGVNYLKRVESKGNIMNSTFGLSENRSRVHTGNSGYGALNLAYLMNPEIIAILGITGNRSIPKFDGSFTRDINHLPKLFASALPQLDKAGIQVFDTTVKSNLYKMRKVPFQQFVKQFGDKE